MRISLVAGAGTIGADSGQITGRKRPILEV
jgi:hypothetical protein